MLTFAPNGINPIRITNAKGRILDLRETASILRQLHRMDRPFAVETVVGVRGAHCLLRTEPEQSEAFGAVLGTVVGARSPAPPLEIPGDDASVRAIHLRGPAAIPIAQYSEKDAQDFWFSLQTAVAKDGEFNGTWVIRVVLRPAPDTWQDAFTDSFKSNVHASTDLGAVKVAWPGFYSEVQVLTAYDANSRARQTGKLALNRLARELVDRAGGDEVWRTVATKSLSKRKAGPGMDLLQGLGVRAPTDFLDDRRALKDVLSPEEVARLWPAKLGAPSTLTVETVRTPPSTLPERPVAPVRATKPAPESRAQVSPRQKPRVEAMPDQSSASTPPASGQLREASSTSRPFYSAQPVGLSVSHIDDWPRLGKKHRTGRHKEQFDEVCSAARASAVRQLALTSRDLLIFAQFAAAPLSSARDLAYAWEWSPTTVYKAASVLERLDLITGVDINMGASLERRYQVHDDRWKQLMIDLEIPHPRELVKRLWLNPDMVAAVYRVLGRMVHENPERHMIAFRWLRTRAFDAVVQCSDGWAAVAWVGIWTDREHLEQRLQACTQELNEWSAGGGRDWAGRLIVVVPHSWQSEVVWRVARRQGWDHSIAIFNLSDRTLTGDLDLSQSRGRIPPAIRDDLKPLRVNVARLSEFRAADPAGRMQRLQFFVEQYPSINASSLQRFTRLNGKDVAAGLAELIKQGRLIQTPGGGFSLDKLALAEAARRDRVWSGLPGRCFGPESLAKSSDSRWNRLGIVTRVLSEFAAAGFTVAPGWQATDGRFKPDGVIWMDSPYGVGWHYVVYAAPVRRESSAAAVLNRSFHATRTDQYPILVICRSDMEDAFWNLGKGLPMLTASVSRIRAGMKADGHGAIWHQRSDPVQISRGNERADLGK